MKRFYKEAGAAQAEDGWRVMLDGRPIRTAAGAAQVVPSRPLAEALAAEWAAQGEKIDAATLPLRDLADYAIDVIAPGRAAAIAALLTYAETDTLCYRADPDEPLYRRQIEVWEPLLKGVEQAYGISLERVSGIIHRMQPETSLAHLHEVLDGHDSFTLAALSTLTSLAASLCVGLAAIRPGADAAALWAAANLEEDWQAELWGKDSEAEARRARRFAAFGQAIRLVELIRRS